MASETREWVETISSILSIHHRLRTFVITLFKVSISLQPARNIINYIEWFLLRRNIFIFTIWIIFRPDGRLLQSLRCPGCRLQRCSHGGNGRRSSTERSGETWKYFYYILKIVVCRLQSVLSSQQIFYMGTAISCAYLSYKMCKLNLGILHPYLFVEKT